MGEQFVWEQGGTVFFGTREAPEALTPTEAETKAPGLAATGQVMIEAAERQLARGQELMSLAEQLRAAAGQARQRI